MLLNANEANLRLNSPGNLRNLLRTFGVPQVESAKEIRENVTSQPLADLAKDIEDGLIKSKAKEVLRSALDNLNHSLDDVTKATDLSKIARDMREILKEDKNEALVSNHQVIIYRPTISSESNFQTVQVYE